MTLKFVKGYIWTQTQTTIHRLFVLYYISKFCLKLNYSLILRAICHDFSKYKFVEAKEFASTIFDLKKSTYGDENYKKLLDKIKPALDNHYLENSHHPEFHSRGTEDMSLCDKIEMICDWKAATKRHKDGDFSKSLVINKKRYNVSDDIQNRIIEIASVIDSDIKKGK